mmetsp:Transcript_26562/g.40198  ORF Transcript_26562/g.40198 Transcript_26562/m.40198 type:complete len:81 (+) Transcript_26562:299-541(+)
MIELRWRGNAYKERWRKLRNENLLLDGRHGSVLGFILDVAKPFHKAYEINFTNQKLLSLVTKVDTDLIIRENILEYTPKE